jgi:hypothetical protein
MLFTQLAIQIALILDCYLGNGSTMQRADEWLGQTNASMIVVIVMGVFILFDLASLSLIGQLLLFHIKLQRQGLSTYQFIVKDNQKRREQTKKENDLKLKRQMMIAHAKQERGSNSFYVWRLQNGGTMREQCGMACCDPLSLDDDEENNNNNNANGTNNNNSKRSQNVNNGGISANNGNNGHPNPSSNVTTPSGQDDDDSGSTTMERTKKI